MRRIGTEPAANSNGHLRGGDPDSAGAAPSALGMAPLLLTEEQAAELLSISPRKLWELSAAGAIPYVKIGSLKRYRRVDLEEWAARGCPATRD